MNVTFLNPPALLLLILLPLVAGFVVWRINGLRKRLYDLGDADLIDRLIVEPVQRRYLWRAALWTLALLSGIIALARPAWGVNMDVIELQGVSVVAVLDVSNSMSAQDSPPSRLEQAKLALHDLYEGLSGHEVGLVLFAGSAVVQFPLTSDVISAQSLLNAASTRSITQQGTAIEAALNEALDLFDPQNPSAKIVVLVSDGENHLGDIERIAASAAESGVVIHSIGLGGAEGEPIPVLGEDGQVVTYKANTGGDLILTRLEEPTLQYLSSTTGGLYQRSTADGSDISRLVQTINQAQTGLLDSREESRQIERFGIFVLLAVLLLSLEIMTPSVRL